MSKMRLWFKSVAVLLAVCALDLESRAADLSPVADQTDSTPPRNSLMVFSGVMSTTTLGRTLVINQIPATSNRTFDNYIVGAAYRRDYLQYGPLTVGGEVGIADRFGHFVECCDAPVVSSGIVQSGELWTGGTFRIDLLLGPVRMTPGVTIGFSVTTNSIGREREREITEFGNARFLGYLSPEVAFSAVSFPNLELVFRVQHRSGLFGTFGGLFEGYNADVVGVRYHF
jgi:hypothetical protein